MVFQAFGACALMRLMRLDREAEPETDWLLYGPSDPEVVKDEDKPPFLLAAE
ncbi:hypothetical protein [Caulobacter sp. SLTY]|uniref:hypothetical protein n=1 Tax=Caulobacter sp. SLTY TaxID=2683262 RepID=UPI0014122E6A|nr:hypothetical protein [Caulobacter sp. SLTY]